MMFSLDVHNGRRVMMIEHGTARHCFPGVITSGRDGANFDVAFGGVQFIATVVLLYSRVIIFIILTRF